MNILFYHYTSIALLAGFISLAVGIGQGLTGISLFKALLIQPRAATELSKTFFLGILLIETAAILGLIVAFTLISSGSVLTHNPFYYMGEIGIFFCITLSASCVGIASAFPARAACMAVARQPFFATKIQLIMLLCQSLMQTPLVLAFIIALLIKSQLILSTHYDEALRLIAAGLCIGLGSIGPTLGLAQVAHSACTNMGVNKYIYTQLFSFTFISQAIIESPLIFSVLVSLSLLFVKTHHSLLGISTGIAYLAAALAMGIGTFAPSFNSGKIAAQAATTMALEPKEYSSIFKASLIGQTFLETSVIYALLIAFILILFH